MDAQRLLLPAIPMRSKRVCMKVMIKKLNRRYTLLSSPSPLSIKSRKSNDFPSITSTPISVRLSNCGSPITHTPDTFSPPVFQRSYEPSSIRTFRRTEEEVRAKVNLQVCLPDPSRLFPDFPDPTRPYLAQRSGPGFFEPGGPKGWLAHFRRL